MPKKPVHKGAFWHLLKFKIVSRKPAANGAVQIIDNSRTSWIDNLTCRQTLHIETNTQNLSDLVWGTTYYPKLMEVSRYQICIKS